VIAGRNPETASEARIRILWLLRISVGFPQEKVGKGERGKYTQEGGSEPEEQKGAIKKIMVLAWRRMSPSSREINAPGYWACLAALTKDFFFQKKNFDRGFCGNKLSDIKWLLDSPNIRQLTSHGTVVLGEGITCHNEHQFVPIFRGFI
jgi:hypothetical protein